MKKLLLQISAILLLTISLSACSEEEITPAKEIKKNHGVEKIDKGF